MRFAEVNARAQADAALEVERQKQVMFETAIGQGRRAATEAGR